MPTDYIISTRTDTPRGVAGVRGRKIGTAYRELGGDVDRREVERVSADVDGQHEDRDGGEERAGLDDREDGGQVLVLDT